MASNIKAGSASVMIVMSDSDQIFHMTFRRSDASWSLSVDPFFDGDAVSRRSEEPTWSGLRSATPFTKMYSRTLTDGSYRCWYFTVKDGTSVAAMRLV
jgi:hypothetical protein